MSKRKQYTRVLKNEKIISRLRIFLFTALTIIIFYPPYLQGLFFEKHVLPTQIFVFVVFIIFLIYKWLKNDYSFFKTPIEYVSFGFVVVYFISIFVAVHTRSAIIEWLKYCMYFAVFYMISDLADNLKTKLLFIWAIIISAVGLSIIGLDSAMGGNIVRILNNFFRALGVQGDLFFGLFVDNRIHSTLQYPNALASYLMAVFFITVGLLMVYNKWWQKVVLGSFSFVLFLTFMLTHSRGAQLLFPLAVIILLIAAPKGNRIKLITHVLILAIPAGVISLFVSPFLSAGTINQKSFILLLSGLLATIFLSLVVKFIGDLLQKISWKVHVVIISFFIMASLLGFNYLINESVPAVLSLESSEENKEISIGKDVALKPNREYFLCFEAEGRTAEEEPYAYFVRVFNRNLNNILFGGHTQLIRKNIPKSDGSEIITINFTTPEDTKLISIYFSVYFSGTSVTISDASIVDVETGETVKKIILKNKYNLDGIISRFQNMWTQQSLVSRAIFYKDGINVFKDNWFLGAGGGAWNYLYREYQSYNYASSQAHNYPLQLGIETGILGIIILFCLVFVLIVTFSKYHKKTNNYPATAQEKDPNLSISLLVSVIFTGIAGLFMHSVIDFDFSESSMLLLFWQLIALFNRELIDCLLADDMNLLRVKMNPKRNKYSLGKERKSLILIGIVISGITLYFSLTFLIASSFAKQSFEFLQENDLETAINKMEKAISLDRYNEKYVLGYNPIPNRPDIKAGLTDILFMKHEMYNRAQKNGDEILETDLSLLQKQFSKAALLIKNIEKKAESNLGLTSDLASYSFRTGEIDKGINYLNSAINYFPFEPSLWHAKVDVCYQMMGKYFNNEDYEKAKEYLLKGLSVIDEAKSINKRNLDPFIFNQNTVDLLQTMKFMLDNWGTDAIYDINEVVHYSMFDLDIDMDGIPDQWRISNTDFMNVYIGEEDLSIKVLDRAYLYTRYPIKLSKEKTYQVEIETDNDVEYLSFYISGITSKALPLTKEGDKYTAEIIIKNEPDEYGNQFRIYFEADCVINSIVVKEK